MSSSVQDAIAKLNDNPDDSDALYELERALTAAEAWEDMVDMLPRHARNQSAPTLRVRYLVRASHVARHVIEEEVRANTLLQEAMSLGLPGDAIVEAIEAAFAEDQDWGGLVAAFLDAVEMAATDPVRSRIFHGMGRAYEDKLFDRERAIGCYQRAFKLDPFFGEPLNAARQIYAHADQWTTVQRLYSIQLQVTRDPQARARLLKELGTVYLERLNERDKALECMKEAVSLDPDLSGLQEVIDRIETNQEQSASGVIISDEIMDDDAAEDEEAGLVEVEVEPVEVEAAEAPGADEEAELQEVELEPVDVEVEAEEPVDDAVEEVAEDEDVDEVADDDAVEEVAEDEDVEEVADDEDVEEVADDDAVEEVADDEDVDEVADDDAVEEVAEDDDVEEVADDDAVEEVAEDEDVEEVAEDEDVEEVAEDVDEEDAVEDVGEGEDAVAAEEAGEDVMELEPEDDEEDMAAIMDDLSADAGPRASLSLTGAYKNALPSLIREAADAGGADSAARYARAIAVSLALGQSAGQIADWAVEAIERSDDKRQAVLDLMPALLNKSEVWEVIRDRLVELDEIDDAAGYAGALYAVIFYALGDLDTAVGYRERAGGIAQAEEEALEVAQKGNWRKTHMALKEAVGDDLEGYRAQAYVALGLDNEDKAVDSLRRILRKNKKDQPARNLIKPLYRKAEKWNALVDIFKREAADMDDVADRQQKILTLQEMIRIYEDHLEQDVMVVNTQQQLLDVDPSNIAVMEELAVKLKEMNRWPDLVDVLGKKADAVQNEEDKVAIHLERAELYIERFSNQAEAIKAYEAVLELRPDHNEALVALEENYEKRREWEKLIDVKKRLVEGMTEPEEQASTLREAADIAATRMRDQELSVELWREVLEILPGDDAALSALEQLYERDKNWDALADVLSRRVDVIEDEDERGQALLKLGQIYGDRLDNVEAAVDSYERLLEIDPSNHRAKDSLKKAYIDLERWDSLEDFFARDDAWSEYVRQIESLAGVVKDDSTKIELLFRAADTWSDRLDNVDRATKDLERILGIDETNQTAAVRLAPIYEEKGDFRRLPGMLEIVLQSEEDPEVRFEQEVKLARLSAEHLRDHEASFKWFGEALSEQPHRTEILNELETEAEQVGSWSALEQLLANAAASLASDPEMGERWLDVSLRLGRVLDENLDDAASALDRFDSVLERHPDNTTALDAKDRIFTRQEDWEALLEVIETKLTLTEETDVRIELLGRMCTIHEEFRGDTYAAIDRYNEILELLDESNDAALGALHRLYRETGDFPALAHILRRLIELHPEDGAPEERAQLELELATVLMEELAAYEEATDVLERVVATNPNDTQARELLEQMLAVEEQRRRTAKILEPLYESDGAWAQLVEVLEIQLETEEDKDTRITLLSRIGSNHADKLADPEASADAYSRLLRIEPRSTEARERLETGADATQNWHYVVDLYESLIDELPLDGEEDVALAVEYAERVAHFYDVKLENLHESVRMQRRVLEFQPERMQALDALVDLFTRIGGWEDLLQVIDDKLALTEDPQSRRGLHFQAAGIWEEMLRDPAQAIEEYRKVLMEFPEDREALGALDRLYGETGDAAAQAEIVERLIGLAEEGTPEELAAKNRLASVFETELGDVERAMELWKAVLDTDPANEIALGALERQLESEFSAMPASEILEPLYAASGDSERLIRVLEIRLQYVEDPDGRRELYHRIASLYENDLASADEAYAVLQRAIAEFLDDQRTLDRLYGFAEVQGRFDELGTTLEELANDAMDPVVARNTLVRVARIREDKLSDVDAAAMLWRQVLDFDPQDREALDALERIYQAAQQWTELVQILIRKSELPDVMGEPDVRKDLLFRAATLYEEMLDDPDEAIEVLRTVLMDDPTERRAIAQLERLYTVSERWEDLVENYERKIELTEEPSDKRELYHTLGGVLQTRLQDPDRAITAYRSVLDFFPEDLETLQALDRLYEATENWYELMETLKLEVGLIEDAELARSIKHRIGRLHELELMDYNSAVRQYAEILAEDPQYMPTREALEGMIQRGDEPLEASKLLEPIYREEGQWDQLVSISHTLIENTDDPQRRRDLYVDVARIQEQQLGNPAAALDAYSNAAKEAPRLEELDEIERLAGATGDWAGTAELFFDLWEDAIDPDVRVNLGLRVAAIREEQLGDDAGAIESYVRVSEEEPTEKRALLALDRLYGRSQQWELLADVIQREIGLAVDEPEMIALRLRLGGVYYEFLEDSVEAVQAYRDVLGMEQGNEDAVAALEGMAAAGVEVFEISSILDPLYRSQERWDKLVELNRARVAAEDSEDERYTIWMDTADVQLQQLEDKQAALNSLGNALFERPEDEALKERIEEIGGEEDQWVLVADIYAALLESQLGDTELFDTSLRLAKVLDEKLGDPANAERAYLMALEVEPGSEPALAALDRIYTAQERWDELSGILGRRREAVYDQELMVSLAFRHAQLYEQQLGDLDAAVQTFHEVLDIDPTHTEALASLEQLYLGRQQWEELFDIYERQANMATDEQARADKLVQMASLATEALDRPSEAIDLWQQVRGIRPEDPTVLQNLALLFEQVEQYHDLVGVIDQQVELAETDDDKAQLLRRLGWFWAERLDNEDMAVGAYNRVLELEPTDPNALGALRVLHERIGDFENLSKVLETMLENDQIEIEEQPTVYEQLGQIYMDTLARTPDAIRTWTAVLQFQPGDEEALNRLEQLYTQEGQWENCVNILEMKLEIAEDDMERIDLLKRIASIWNDNLQNQEQAAGAFERILDLDIGDIDAALALERIYEVMENWTEIVNLSVDRLEVIEDEWERMEVMRKAARICEEKLEQPELAFAIMSKALLENPADEEVRKHVEELAKTSGQVDALVETYTQLIQQIASENGEEETLPIQLSVGRLMDGTLERPEMAEIYYDRALSIDPENEEALAALESIYQRTEDWESLVGILKKRADLVYDALEQVELWKRAGAILEEQIGDLPNAIEAYKQVLEIEDTNQDALTSLERIYETAGQWRELIEILERRAESTYEPDVLIPIRFRIGTLFKEQLEERENAVDAFRDVTAIQPDYAPALEELEGLYLELEAWDDYLEVLESRLVLDLEPEHKVTIYGNQARVYEQQFDDIDRAVMALNQSLTVIPTNLEAISELERIFGEQERYDELVETYERHVQAVEEPEAKIEVLCTLAEAFVAHLDDVFRAISTYQRVLEIDEAEPRALARAGELYEQAADWDKAVDAYERLARVAPEPERRLQLLLRAGEIYEQEMENLDDAEARYRMGLDLEPGSIPVMQALQRVFMSRGEWDKAIEILHQQIEYTRDLLPRADFMVQIGEIYEAHLEDNVQAQRLYEQAIELDPRSIDAAAPLAEMYLEQERWERARPLLEMLIHDERFEVTEEGELLLYFNLGMANEKLGFDDDAIEAYEKVLEYDTSYLHALIGLARLYYRSDKLDDAYRIYLDLLSAHRDSMADEEVVDTFHRAGLIKQKLGDVSKARDMFQRALEINPDHTESLRKLVEVLAEADDVASLVDAKRKLLDVTTDEYERFTLLVDLGDGLVELGDNQDAIKSYREAIAIDDTSKVVLHKLLNIFSEAGNWKRAVEVLGRLAELEEDPQRHAKLCFTIGAIFRDELGDIPQAVTFFNRTLDTNPDNLQAFEAIDKMLTKAKNWKELERNYRKMIERYMAAQSDANEEVRFMLLKGLGEIYRSRLNEMDKSIDAFKIASQMRPEDEELHMILAELYRVTGRGGDEVIAEHKKLIAVSPFRIESYRALFNAYLKGQEFDQAWCMASALSLLQNATPEEEEFYRKYLPNNVQKARRPLSGDHWRLLYHEELDRLINNIFDPLASSLRDEFSRDIREWGVHKRKNKIDLEAQMPISKMLQYVLRIVGAPTPLVYEKQDYVGIRNANSDPIALIAGRDVLSGKAERELAFETTKATALLRPEFYLASAFPATDYLKIFFFASLAVTTGQIMGNANVESVQTYAQAIMDLPEPVRIQITRFVQQFLNSGRNPDLSAWLRAVDHTASRVGLVVCGDLRTAVNAVKNEQNVVGKATVKDKVKELVLFSISDDYFRIRKELGLALGTK